MKRLLGFLLLLFFCHFTAHVKQLQRSENRSLTTAFCYVSPEKQNLKNRGRVAGLETNKKGKSKLVPGCLKGGGGNKLTATA